jgi:RHS repeat-associated protein
MPVCEQEYEDGVLQQTRVNLLGARGIEAVVAIDHTRGNQVALRWWLYDGHGNLVRTMAPDYTPSAFQWRGVWGEVQSSLGTGRGYCANLGHPEDETGLVYMRARYYEPATGRFISEDPARDGVNWYLYANGNPVNKVDYEGKSPDDDSFDPVYYFNFGKWWVAYWLAVLSPPLRIAIGWALSGPRGAALAAISSAVSLAYVAASIVELYSLRIVAWYVFLFEELPSDFLTSPVIGDLPFIGFYDRPWDARNIL